jgi:sulfite exporter TauE/SafE
MEAIAINGFALGLSTGVYCLGACAPVALPYLASRGDSLRASSWAVAQLAGGRLVTYIVLGAAAAVLGAQIQALPVAKTLVAVAMMGLAGLMIGYGLSRNFPESHACGRMAQWPVVKRFPFVAGMLMGVNMCPPLLLCATTIVSLNNVLWGMVLAACFFLGSIVFMLPLVFAGLLGRWEMFRGVASVATLFCGLWFMVKGISLLVHAG